MDPLIPAGVALVTGAGSGIGQQIAVTFAQRGCTKLFLVDLNQAGLEKTKELVAEVSGDVETHLLSANVADETAVKGMVEQCVEKFGRIDFACNNAGIATQNIPTTEIDVKTFDKVFDVNLKSIYLCHKYEINAMAKQEPIELPGRKHANHCRGSIVNTASMAGLAVTQGLPVYNASKHGVVSMTRVDARQFAPDGVRINCVCPGFVDTPLMRGSGLSDEFLEGAKSQAPMKRFTVADEIADGVLFLSGSFASAVTGTSLPVDAGALLFHII